MLCNIHTINILIVPLGIDYELFERYFDLFKSYSCIPIQDINNTIDASKKVFVHFIPLFQDRNLGISDYIPQTGNFGIIGVSDKEHNHNLNVQVEQFFELCKEKHSNSLAKCLLFNSEGDEMAHVTSVPKVGNVNFYVYQLLCDSLSEILRKMDDKIKLIESNPYPPTPLVLKAFEDVNLSPMSSPTLKDLFSTTTDESRILQLKSSGRTFKLLGDYYMLKGEFNEAINKLKNATDLLKTVDPIWYAGALWSWYLCELMAKVVNLIEPTTFRESQQQLDKEDSTEMTTNIKEYIIKLKDVLLLYEQQSCHLLSAEVLYQIIQLQMNSQITYTFQFRLDVDALIIRLNSHCYALNDLIKSKYYIRCAHFYTLLKYERRTCQFIFYAIKAINQLKPMNTLKSITPLILNSLNTLGYNENTHYCVGWIYLLIEFINHALALATSHELHETRAYLAYIGLTRLYHHMNLQDQSILMHHFRAGKEIKQHIHPLILSMKLIKPLNEFDIHIVDYTVNRKPSTTDPFIYNPFADKPGLTDKLESSIDDVITVEITICNPFWHVLNLSNFKLNVTDGLAECKSKNITINPKTISTLHLKVIPQAAGTMTINGCTVNCPELGLNDQYLMSPIILSHTPDKQKYVGLLEIQRAMTPVIPNIPRNLELQVVESVPFLKLGFSHIGQTLMLFNGEIYEYTIPLINSSGVLINHFTLGHSEVFSNNLKSLDIDKLCWLDTFNKHNPSLTDFTAPKQILANQAQHVTLNLLGKPHVTTIVINMEYGYLNDQQQLRFRKLQIPLEITLISFLKIRTIDIRPDVDKDHFLFALDVENHWHESVELTIHNNNNATKLLITPGGCERIEMVLQRLEIIKPLPMLNKFEYLQLSELEMYDYKNLQSRESYYYKCKLLELIDIAYNVPSSHKKGTWYLHDLELSQPQIQGILKSMMKIILLINKIEISALTVLRVNTWESFHFHVHSFTRIQFLKFKFVLYQDCQNNHYSICDVDQVLIQGKMHRLMSSTNQSWTTTVVLLISSPGLYYLKCQVEDVGSGKVTTANTWKIKVD